MNDPFVRKKKINPQSLTDPNTVPVFKMRPDDPYCHGAVGKLEKTNSILLRLHRKKRKLETDPEEDWKTTVVGVVSDTITFPCKSNLQNNSSTKNTYMPSALS